MALLVPEDETEEGGDAAEADGTVNDASFRLAGDFFVKDDIAISGTGVVRRDSSRVFSVVPETLDLGDIIGRGCSSIVQRAVHKPTGTALALKIVNLWDKAKRHQLMREIDTLYDAECEALIRFYGAFYREGAITIALEYMDGGSLANVLHQAGPIPEPALAGVAFQALWGLAFLKHDKRVHRDIKPSNVLINSEGRIALTDFGVSASLLSSIAMCGTFVGTFKYMSPERIRHEPHSFSSDIWSLGFVVLECALGRYPYRDAGTAIEVVEEILESPEPHPPEGAFTREFEEFLGHCLVKDPSKRLPADVLMGAPWLKRHGVTSLPSAVGAVRRWIEEYRGGGGGGGGSGGGGTSLDDGGKEADADIEM